MLAYIFIVFILGLIFGSFANVCIYRLPRECLSPFKGYSFCPKCFNVIKWYDNIPVISYILLRGKCRYCKNKISIIYPIVEIFTALLFLLSFYKINCSTRPLFSPINLSKLIFLWYLSLVLIITSFIDAKYKIIPDELTLPGIPLSIIFSVFATLYPEELLTLGYIKNIVVSRITYAIIGIAVGGGTLYIIGLVGEIILRKEAIGFGDVKFMGMFGGFLGWQLVLISFIIACVIGSLFGIFYFIFTRKHYIPFGPFLCIGVFLTLFFGQQVLTYIQLLLSIK